LAVLLDCAIADVADASGTEDIAELEIANDEQFLMKLYSVTRKLTALCERHGDKLSVFNDPRYEAVLRGVFDKTAETAHELESVNEKISAQKEANQKLTEEESKLERERGHLLDAEAQRDKLQQDIARLSDPALDAMAAERDKSEAELAERQRREKELLGAKLLLEKELEAAERSCEARQSEAQALQESIDASNENLSQLKESNAKSDETLAGIQAEIEGLQAGQKSFEEKRDKLAAERGELESRMNIYINTLNAAAGQGFAAHVAESAESGWLAEAGAGGYEGLQKAVNAASESLEKHFLQYSALISDFVVKSQALTKTPDKNQEGETE
jgi:chromosome segregation ATPase